MENKDKCICKGNWRLIISECKELIGKQFIDTRTNKEYTFFGVVHSDDDYYYGMYNKENGLRLLSCVGNLDTHGYRIVVEALK